MTLQSQESVPVAAIDDELDPRVRAKQEGSGFSSFVSRGDADSDYTLGNTVASTVNEVSAQDTSTGTLQKKGIQRTDNALRALEYQPTSTEREQAAKPGDLGYSTAMELAEIYAARSKDRQYALKDGREYDIPKIVDFYQGVIDAVLERMEEEKSKVA